MQIDFTRYRYFVLSVLNCGAAVTAVAEPTWDVADTGQPAIEAEFTVSEGTWMSVDVSPDGQHILFDLLGDIYRIPATGGAAVLVHGGPAMQVVPSYSPDGTEIVYVSDASGSDNIWISRADGSNPRQVTRETTDVLASPAWDSGGNYVAAAKRYGTFSRMRASEIRLFHVAGGSGRLTVPTPANQRDVHEAEFSDDGKFLYYTQRVGSPSIFVDPNHTNFAVMRRNLETGATDQLIGGFGGASTPQESPDGRRIAFIRRVKEKTVLFEFDTVTGRQRPVYAELDRDAQADFMQQGNYYPQFDWFPDSRHVAIWGKGKLLRIDMDTADSEEIPFEVTARHRITRTARFETELAPESVKVRAVRGLTVDAGERNAVFTALGNLWVKRLPDGTPVRLSKTDAFEADPAFSRDGRRLAFVEWRDERGSALKVGRPGPGEARTVVESSGIIRQPTFSPDGKRLVYRIEAGQKYMGGHRERAGIYWVSLEDGRSHFVSDKGLSPVFSPDGQRIYYSYISSDDDSLYYSTAVRVSKLESVRLDGFDVREHAVGTDVREFVLSPDLRWLGFVHQRQYFLMPYRETGQPLQVSTSAKAVPVSALTDTGGYNLTWTADSSRIYWSLGPSLYRAEPTVEPGESGGVPKMFTSIDLEVPGDVPDGALALTNARIITMVEDEVIEKGTVVVVGNRITAVGSSGSVEIPEEARILDMAGKVVMPGLIDMHGHIDCCYGTTDMMPQKQPSRYAALAFGVTTNFDPYSSNLPAYAVQEMNQAGITVGPRSISVGSVVYGRSKKPDFVFAPIEGIEDARRVMARKQALGGSIIKSYKQPMRSQRQQLVLAGRETGIMVDVEGESHFYNNISMILDGHVALEHNLPVANYYDDLVQLFAHSEVAHTPTLVVVFGELFGENYLYQKYRSWEDPRIRNFVQEVTASYSPIDTPLGAPPHVRGMTSIHVADELWDVGFRAVARSMKKLDDAGVLVNAGSHGQVAGLAMHWELELLAQGGMSNHRVLRAGTINGARTLALDGQIGSIEAGKLADLIVLDRDPLADIANTRSVHYTMINGRLYDAYSMSEIGNHDRPRGRFYWELPNYNGIDWNEAWLE